MSEPKQGNMSFSEMLNEVQRLAEIMSTRLPLNSFLTKDDLAAAGYMGAVEAQETYNPAKCKFKTYLRMKVKWAMINALRRSEWPSRHIRKKYPDAKTMYTGLCPDVEHNDNHEKSELIEVLQLILTERETTFLTDYYLLGYTYAEVGRRNNVTQSRAYQIVTEAVKKLRNDSRAKVLQES